MFHIYKIINVCFVTKVIFSHVSLPAYHIFSNNHTAMAFVFPITARALNAPDFVLNILDKLVHELNGSHSVSQDFHHNILLFLIFSVIPFIDSCKILLSVK